MNNVRPALLDGSQRYDHLREVTTDDIQAILVGLHGTRRSSFLVSLRSLFAFWDKKKGMVFRPGQRHQGRPAPLRHRPAPRSRRRRPGRRGCRDPVQRAGCCARRSPCCPHRRHPRRPARRPRPGQPQAHHRRTGPPDRRVHPPDPARQASTTGAPAGRTPPTSILLINQQSAMGTGPVSTDHLRQDQTPRPGRDPGTAARRPATRGSPRPRTRPAAPGSGIRPRPQDCHPLRRERPIAPRPPGPRSRSRQFPRNRGLERATKHQDPEVHRENPSVRLNSGISRPSRNNGAKSASTL